jgi:hypothetical protein
LTRNHFEIRILGHGLESVFHGIAITWLTEPSSHVRERRKFGGKVDEDARSKQSHISDTGGDIEHVAASRASFSSQLPITEVSHLFSVLHHLHMPSEASE